MIRVRIAEEWRSVVGWESCYEVSNLGGVRSVDRVQPFRKGVARYKGKRLHPGVNNGRLMVLLRRRGRASVGKYVHNLVLEAFVGPRPAGFKGCHENDNPFDNWVGNLYWGTHSQNMRDAIRNGVKVYKKGPRAKLTLVEVARTRALYQKGRTYSYIARELGVSRAQVMNIVKGRCWKAVA